MDQGLPSAATCSHEKRKRRKSHPDHPRELVGLKWSKQDVGDSDHRLKQSVTAQRPENPESANFISAVPNTGTLGAR